MCLICNFTYDEHLVAEASVQAVAAAVPSVPCTHLIAASEINNVDIYLSIIIITYRLINSRYRHCRSIILTEIKHHKYS